VKHNTIAIEWLCVSKVPGVKRTIIEFIPSDPEAGRWGADTNLYGLRNLTATNLTSLLTRIIALTGLN